MFNFILVYIMQIKVFWYTIRIVYFHAYIVTDLVNNAMEEVNMIALNVFVIEFFLI